MADADVKLTSVSKGGAKLGSVIPAEAMSKSDGKVLPAAARFFAAFGSLGSVVFEDLAEKVLETSTY